DVVARALEMVEQTGDLIEHQVHRARDFSDVILSRKRETLIEVAVHDPDDGVMNALESLRCAISKPNANGQDQKDRGQESNRKRLQQSLLQVVILAQAAPEKKNAPVRASAGDKNGRVLVAVRVGEDIFVDNMCLRVDWDFR